MPTPQSYYLSLNGARAVTVDLQTPYYGAWCADVSMALPATFTGPQTLVIGNLSLVGSALRSQSFAGEGKVRLYGGFGGWPKTLTAQAYQNPGGILASTVLKDAAANVGEQVNVIADATVGQFWTVEAKPAIYQLRILCPLWWTDPATGTTQCNTAPGATRPSSTITSDFEVLSYEPGKGLFKITTEDPASWQPGATFTNAFLPTTFTVSSVRLVSGEDGDMHLSVLTAP